MRQSWKPSLEIACSMALRENLCGGASREPSVPVSPQGAYLPGSLLPDSSPAKACRSSLAWEVNMKRRMGRAFTDGQMAAPTKIGLELRKAIDQISLTQDDFRSSSREIRSRST